MRPCVIFNRNSGRSEQVGELLLSMPSSVRCELRPADSGAAIAKAARGAVAEGFDRIIAAGGDGTIRQVVDGIASDFDAVELAVLPMGTGNDFARALGLSPDRLEEACRVAFASELARIDIVRTSAGTHFANAANGGLGGDVATSVEPDDKARWGSLAYWITSVSRLVDPPTYDMELLFDDRRMELKGLGIVVANGCTIGGGFPIAPGALLDDGYLDVTVVPVMPAVDLLTAGVLWTLGGQEHENHVSTHRARRVTVRSRPAMPFSIDGEGATFDEITFEVLPRVLRVLVGPDAEGVSETIQRPSG